MLTCTWASAAQVQIGHAVQGTTHSIWAHLLSSRSQGLINGRILRFHRQVATRCTVTTHSSCHRRAATTAVSTRNRRATLNCPTPPATMAKSKAVLEREHPPHQFECPWCFCFVCSTASQFASARVHCGSRRRRCEARKNSCSHSERRENSGSVWWTSDIRTE